MFISLVSAGVFHVTRVSLFHYHTLMAPAATLVLIIDSNRCKVHHKMSSKCSWSWEWVHAVILWWCDAQLHALSLVFLSFSLWSWTQTMVKNKQKNYLHNRFQLISRDLGHPNWVASANSDCSFLLSREAAWKMFYQHSLSIIFPLGVLLVIIHVKNLFNFCERQI